MQNYLDRLTACGVRIDHALVIVSDFLRDLDFDGLSDYCAEMERLYAKDIEQSVWEDRR